MTRHAKAWLGTALGTVILAGLVGGWVYYWAAKPGVVRDVSGRMTLQSVGTIGPRYGHSTWVSFLAQNSRGEWKHETEIRLPAHSLIHVTILQYDSATGLRNPLFARVQGTTGGVMQLDGKTVEVVNPNQPAHTFAIPQLSVVVPLPGVPGNAPNQCSAAPCTLAEAHRTITFTFRTETPGRFRWQCFVPCGAGYVDGNGGPMQAYGYMTGYLDVV